MTNTKQMTNKIIYKYNLKAVKKLGQNFLIDDEVLDNIVQMSDIYPDDLVIEIGPGLGNLTEYIFKKTNFVLAIEYDKKMIQILHERFEYQKNFEILNADILKINIADEIQKYKNKYNDKKIKNIKVIANLPYYITTPILFNLFENQTEIESLTLMMQKEVANRIIAKPNSKEYGILTIMSNYFSIPEILFDVSPTSFIPSPNVTSSVIKFDIIKRYNVKDQKIFVELVKKSFAQRRKKLLNSLYSNSFMNLSKSDLENLFKKCNIDENTRAEQLDIQKYVEIVDKSF